MAYAGPDQSKLEKEFNAYKKEIGKQYMDGILSDKEYESMLDKKKKELGLGSEPAHKASGNDRECPTCGALVHPLDIECKICGTALTPDMVSAEVNVRPEEFTPNMDIPDDWREQWLIKEYREMPAEDLLKQRPDAIKGISADDAELMRTAFNVKTLEDFATLKFVAWAQELVTLKCNPSAYRRKDFRDKLVRKYEDRNLEDILQAPTHALQGLSEKDAEKLVKAFNIKTIEDLGKHKFMVWASKIHEIATWREKWLVKQHRQLPIEELLKLPPDVLKGVSEDDSHRMKDAFNIRTLEDFATNKYLLWARELVALRQNPSSFRNQDFKHKLIKEYEDKGLEEILKSPTYALQGVSEADAKNLVKAFNTKTLEELGNLKFITWAIRIYGMAPPRRFKVGDRVLLPSGQTGKVASVTEPDSRGLQKVEVAVSQ